MVIVPASFLVMTSEQALVCVTTSVMTRTPLAPTMIVRRCSQGPTMVAALQINVCHNPSLNSITIDRRGYNIWLKSFDAG